MAKSAKVNSIHILAKEWFDRANGNSYFSVRIEVNGIEAGIIPMQYGYGNSYLDAANDFLSKNGTIDNPEKGHNMMREPLWRIAEKMGLALYTHKIERCLKRELDK